MNNRKNPLMNNSYIINQLILLIIISLPFRGKQTENETSLLNFPAQN